MTTWYIDPATGSNANSGVSWALAWADINGATAAKGVVAGDTVKIAKSPAPFSIGNATWNQYSKTVTLAGALTLNVELCETGWALDNGAALVHDPVATDAKEGAYCVRITAPASPATSTLYAHKTISSTAFNAYQKLSFWLKNEAAILANHWNLCLCSDTAGVTVVDTIAIPAIPSVAQWVCLTIARNGGGNLGSAIQSVALYSGSVAPTASKYVRLDCIIACTTSGLNLQSLISKNTGEQGGEPWYGIKSINDVTILLDNETNCKATAGRGYDGATETVATYARETFNAISTGGRLALAPIAGTSVQVPVVAGTAGNLVSFEGGYDTGTGLQTGETFFDGLNGFGYAFYPTVDFGSLNHVSFYRYNYGYAGLYANWTINNSAACNNTANGVYDDRPTANGNLTLWALNNNGGSGYRIVYWRSGKGKITINNACNNSGSGIVITASVNLIIPYLRAVNNEYGMRHEGAVNLRITTYISANNTASVYRYSGGGVCSVYNASIGEATVVTYTYNYHDSWFVVDKWGGSTTDKRIYLDGGRIYNENTVRHTASGFAWKLSPTSTIRSVSYPIYLKVAEIAVNANAEVTVSAWLRRTDTGLTVSLVCRGGQIAGVDSDVSASMTAAIDTWEQVTINFTPTEAGVVEIEVQCYGGTTYSGYVDDLSVSQTGGPVRADLLTLNKSRFGLPWCPATAGVEAGSGVFPIIGGSHIIQPARAT